MLTNMFRYGLGEVENGFKGVSCFAEAVACTLTPENI
jgi:hypothetical protein